MTTTRMRTMNRRLPQLLLAGVIAVGATPAFAAAQMTIGVKGGMNLATGSLTVSDTKMSPGTRTSFHGGAVIGMVVGGGIAVEGQVRLTGKGFEAGEAGSGVNRNLSMDYVEFPVLATFTFPRDPSLLAARLFAGPSVNLRASCNLEAGVDQTGFTDCDGDLSKTIDVGAVVGAGIKVGGGLGGFILDVSYDFGLIDVTRGGEDGPDGSLYNRNLLVSAGFVVPIL